MIAETGIHLGIDAVGIKHSGGATVLKDLLASATRDDRFRKISVFCSPRRKRAFDLPSSNKVSEIECALSESSRLWRLWWLSNGIRHDLRKAAVDVLLCLGGVGRGSPSVPHVTFIQQSLPFHPDALASCLGLSRLKMRLLFAMMRRSCRASQAIIVQTPTMQRLVAEAFAVPDSRISVVLPPSYDLPRPTSPSPQLHAMRGVAQGLRMLYVGNQSGYKNVRLIVESMRALRWRIPGLTLFLTWPEDDAFCRVEGVVGLGYLREGAILREAYELATAVIMPSLAETVGFPMLEAMNAGTPVLAADRPYAHDICEDAAVFFNPFSAEDLISKVVRLMSDEGLRRGMILRGRDLMGRRNAGTSYERMLSIVATAASLFAKSGGG